MLRKSLKYVVLIAALLLGVAQFIQPERTNPPTDSVFAFEAVAKPDPDLVTIVQRACYDCHSHRTVWPWYSGIAPVSWLVADDVKDGRAHLNFSQWNLYSPEMARKRLKEACQEVRKGEMPLWKYQLMHPEARLSDEDVNTICDAASQVP